MHMRWRVVVLLAAVVALGTVPEARTQGKSDKKDKPKGQGPDPNLLSLEVAALRTLRTLQATPAQLKGMLDLLKPGLVKKVDREPAKVSPQLRKNLRLLRDALAKDDEEEIDTYGKKVEVLRDDEDEVFDDD